MASRSKVPVNVAQAMACAAKMQRGQTCTVAEMKATALLLKQALGTARSTAKAAKKEADDLREMVNRLLGRLS